MSKSKYDRNYCPSYVLEEACDMDVACKWNTKKDKCQKKKIKYKRSYCPSYALEEACGMDVECEWNEKKDKCYKKKSASQEPAEVVIKPIVRVSTDSKKNKRSYTVSECPSHKQSESCDKHEGCKWDSKKEKCYKKRSKQSKKRSSKKVKVGRVKVPIYKPTAINVDGTDDDDGEEESSEDIPLGVLIKQLDKLKKRKSSEESSEDIPLGELLKQSKKRRISECPSHKTSEPCSKHEGCKWNSQKGKCYKKYVKKPKRPYSISECPSHKESEPCNKHEGCKWNTKKSKCYKKYVKKPKSWNEQMSEYMSEHPEKSLGESAKAVSKQYKKGKDKESEVDIDLILSPAGESENVKRTKRTYSRSECPSHKESEPCDKHEGCKWNTKKGKCYKKYVKKSWNEHVSEYMSEHPEKSLGESSKAAKKTYKKLDSSRSSPSKAIVVVGEDESSEDIPLGVLLAKQIVEEIAEEKLKEVKKKKKVQNKKRTSQKSVKNSQNKPNKYGVIYLD